MSEFMQLEIGISTKRYFPAIGTAGFERLAVSGNNLEPFPPPKIMANVLILIFYVFARKVAISSSLLVYAFSLSNFEITSW